MKYFTELIGKHEGQPAIVICGGPSAPDQLKTIKKKVKDPVLISVNEHGCKLDKCDYMVALDNIGYKDRGLGKPTDLDTQIITPYSWADYRLTGYWNATNSGRTACWVAWKLGCSPVILIGVDMYVDGTYFWSKGAHSSGHNQKLDQHLNEWRVVLSRVPPEILTAAGGPLVEHEVFPKFDARRKYPQVEFKNIERANGKNSPVPKGQKIRVLKGCWIEGQQFYMGEEPVVRQRSARSCVAARKAEYVN